MIKIKRHTEGDSRVAKEVPTFEDFRSANCSHVNDVTALARFFEKELRERIINHDWTKLIEPYESLFYRDLCAAIEKRKDFMDGEWAKIHYTELERHHLNDYCPEDVNLVDVIEMICDCVAAGMARTGDVDDVHIHSEILKRAVANTVKMLKAEIEVVD